MSDTISAASSSSCDEKRQENNKNEMVLKDSNKRLETELKTQARKVPAKVNATRTYSTPPFSKDIYDLFIGALKYGEPAYPTSRELRRLDFYTCKGTTHRKKFRIILTRFEVHAVPGSLVFSPNLEEEVLIYKRTWKVLVPRENVDKIIRRAHLWGSNETNEEDMDERMAMHYKVSYTLAVLERHFSVKEREFGISRNLIEEFIKYRCPTCYKRYFPNNDKINLKQLNNHDENMACSLALQSVDKTIPDDEELTVNKIERTRFPSMAAHVPDRSCIWYDRKSIAETTNRFQKLTMVLSEMRGDMALTFKGDLEARQRLEAKFYCAQLLIKDHAKTIEKCLVHEDSPSVFRTQLQVLQQEYKKAGQGGIFSSDITNLLQHVKDNRLVLSPLLIKEIEDFLDKK